MARNLFHRDFTLARAGLLAMLMVVAMAAGKLPAEPAGIAHDSDAEVRFLPAVIHLFGADCEDSGKDKGVRL